MNSNNEAKKNQTLINLIYILKNKDMSIAELQRQTNIKRSTLIYYLTALEAQGLIIKKRITEGQTGQPTILKFNNEKWESNKKEFEENFEKQKLELLSNPIINESLKIINENPLIEEEDLLKKINGTMDTPKLAALDFLYKEGYIEFLFRITPKGKELLENKHKTE
jgi:predicted transcriptional regulator